MGNVGLTQIRDPETGNLYEYARWAWYEKIGYNPTVGQKWLLDRIDDPKIRFYVMVCGRRWGKSMTAARVAEPTLILPGKRVWVVAPTYDLTRKVIREIRKTIVNGYMRKDKMKLVTDMKTGPVILEFPWDIEGVNTILEGKSATNPDSLIGEEVDLLIIDEAARMKQSHWEGALRATVSSRQGKVLFITTPQGYNWIYDLFKRGQDPEYPEWVSHKEPSCENPYLNSQDIAEAKRTLSEAAFAQEYGADFTMFYGQVYKDFDEGIHIMPYEEMDALIQPGWRFFRSIDFGYENPFVCLYIAVDPSDRVYIYDEYYQRYRTVEFHAEQLNEQQDREYEYTVSDVSGRTERATLRENGIVTLASGQDVLAGLEVVRQHLKLRDDGKPGLYVSSRCVETIKEFNLYHYPERGDIEIPAKEHDHAMDCVRYLLMNMSIGYTRQTVGVYA